MLGVVRKIFGDFNERELKRMQRRIPCAAAARRLDGRAGLSAGSLSTDVEDRRGTGRAVFN